MDIKILNRNIQDLQAHFKTLDNLPARTLKCWGKYLMESLSAEELEQAVELAVITYGRNYDLSAKALVELVKGSEKELVYECWARVLDVLSKRISLDELDDASLYAIAQLGGLTYLGSLNNDTLQDLNYAFKAHWQAFKKNPREFRRPVEPPTPPEHREFKPDEIEAELTPEQKAQNEWLKKQLQQLASLNKSKRKSSDSTTNGHHN